MQSQVITASKLALFSEPVREDVTSSCSQSNERAVMLLVRAWSLAGEAFLAFLELAFPHSGMLVYSPAGSG